MTFAEVGPLIKPSNMETVRVDAGHADSLSGNSSAGAHASLRGVWVFGH